MDRFFVIHYNELGLKKGNRDYFENALCTNINTALQDCRAERAKRISGRVLLPLKPDSDLPEIKKRLGRLFGIAYFGEAWASPLVADSKVTSYEATPEYQGKSFVPIAIKIVASDPGSFTTAINIWGKALARKTDA